jgi:hypothetical protein
VTSVAGPIARDKQSRENQKSERDGRVTHDRTQNVGAPR